MRNKILGFTISFLLTIATIAAGAAACSKPLSSLSDTTNQTPTVTIETPVSRDQAIGIAAQNLPAAAIAKSEITAQLTPSYLPGSDYVWWVLFDGFFLSGDQMAEAGWHIGPDTHMSGTVGGGFGFAYFDIDPVSGTVIQKDAGGIWAPPLQIINPTPIPTVFTQLPLSELPVAIISVSKTDIGPAQPGGADVKITLENNTNQGIASLVATLPSASFGPAEYSFDVSSSKPLNPGATATETQVLLNGGEIGVNSYLMTIQGTFSNGKTFNYEQYIQIM